jgi:hypothetical protein
MYAVTHFSVGLMLGQAANNPYFACAYGLASHIVLDLIPHSDYNKTVQGVLDLAAVAAVAYVSVRAGTGISGLLAGLAAILPDLEVALAHLAAGRQTGRQKPGLFFPTHSGLIRHGRLPMPWGAITQVITVAMVWAVIGRT